MYHKPFTLLNQPLLIETIQRIFISCRVVWSQHTSVITFKFLSAWVYIQWIENRVAFLKVSLSILREALWEKSRSE